MDRERSVGREAPLGRIAAEGSGGVDTCAWLGWQAACLTSRGPASGLSYRGSAEVVDRGRWSAAWGTPSVDPEGNEAGACAGRGGSAARQGGVPF